jgi:PAS domain S-box-containing protein
VASADIRIQSVIDQILDGMITIDEKGKVYSMNPAAKQMFGYAEGDAFATDFTELIPTIFLDGQESPVPSEKAHLAERTGKTTRRWLAATKGTSLSQSSFH